VHRIEIAAIAALELAEAHDWYEEREEGLGGSLLAEFQKACSQIRERPLAFTEVEGATRRVLLKRFPYGVFFVVNNDLVSITAFFHARRDPRHRLGR